MNFIKSTLIALTCAISSTIYAGPPPPPTPLPPSNASLQSEVASLQTQVAALQKQLTSIQSNHALLLGPFVNVDPNPEIGVIGPNIIFTGANIHIVSGSGSTNDNGNPTGLGNLIIGYDESPLNGTIATSFVQGDRTGSHNLLIGRWNKFDRSSFGGFVAGEMNSIVGEASAIVGGWRNVANAQASVVLGGEFNIASGNLATVSGGDNNYSRGIAASIVGGMSNIEDGYYAVILGSRNVTGSTNLEIIP